MLHLHTLNELKQVVTDIHITKLAKKLRMRRLIYDMFYADEISEDVAYKLIDKLNKIRDKTKYSWER
jgi:hypothetical protein